MNDHSNLASHPTFLAMTRLIPSLKRRASAGWILALPPKSTSSLQSHVLKPSPFYKNTFMTLNGGIVLLQDNTLRTIRTDGGFEVEVVARIIHEENFYNDQYKPFRVMALERSLCEESDEDEDKEKGKKMSSMKDSVEEDMRDMSAWLRLVPSRFRDKDSTLSCFLDDMKYRYVFVPKIPSARRHALTKIKRAIDLAIGSRNGKDEDEEEEKEDDEEDDIRNALEHYIFSQLHSVIFKCLQDQYKKKESIVRKEFKTARNRGGLQPDEVGLQSRFHGVSLDRAVEEMKQLCEETCPCGKIQCIRRVGRYIHENLNELVRGWSLRNRFNRDESTQSKNNKEVVIAGDDILPLFVLVVVRAEPADLHANVEYMSNWTLSDIRSESGFYLANFAAAVQYITNHGLGILSSTRSISRSMVVSSAECSSPVVVSSSIAFLRDDEVSHE